MEVTTDRLSIVINKVNTNIIEIDTKILKELTKSQIINFQSKVFSLSAPSSTLMNRLTNRYIVATIVQQVLPHPHHQHDTEKGKPDFNLHN